MSIVQGNCTNPLAIKKTKGSIAEMVVAAEIMKLGWGILFPFGENCRYDLVAEKHGVFVRVQVKYISPRKGALIVKGASSNNWAIKPYTSQEIELIAVYDPLNSHVYYVPIAQLRGGALSLRISPSKNRQVKRIQHAASFANFPF